MIAGFPPPVRGHEISQPDELILDRVARGIVTEEAGHGRLSITTSYLGVMLAGGFYDEAAGGLKVLIVNILCVMLAQVVTLILIRLWRRRRLQGQLTAN